MKLMNQRRKYSFSHKNETESSFEPQRKSEALQASNNYDNCQDTLPTIRNKTLPAV